MEGKPVITPIDPDALSFKYKRNVIEEVNLIKKNICGKINGRTCADGSKQKRYLK